MKDKLPAKISLGLAADIISRSLEILTDKSDGYEDDFNLTLSSYISAANISMQESIDRRKYLIREAKSKIDLARMYKRELNKQIKKYKKIVESITKSTRDIVLENPEVKFKDSFGKPLFISGNCTESLEIRLNYRKKVIDHVLSKETINLLKEKGYGEYITEDSYLVIDTDKLLADLKSGKEIEFADLINKKILRGLK